MELEFLKQINSLLADLESITHTKTGLVSENKTHDGLGSYGERQGEYNEKTRLFKTPFEEILMKAVIRTDSYGEYEKIVSIAFVQPIEKTIVAYEKL